MRIAQCNASDVIVMIVNGPNIAWAQSEWPGFTYYDVDAFPEVGRGWSTPDSGTTWNPKTKPDNYILTGSQWVMRFTDDEWDWIKTQRKVTPATAASKELDKMLDAIQFTNSVDVNSANMDPFYNWLLNNGIPGGQTRIDELREPV
jgi:hypothetical protein